MWIKGSERQIQVKTSCGWMVTLKIDHCAKEIEANALKPLLDAQNIDVYRGTHAVIFMICPFSLESLDYARKEVHEVPSNVAIIFLLGYR